MPALTLLPKPQSLKLTRGQFRLPKRGWIMLDLSEVCAGIPAFNIAEQLATTLESSTGILWNIVRGVSLDAKTEIRCTMDPAIPHDQGYAISITPADVTLRARNQVGLYYAALTLGQIARQSPKSWPCLEIADAPAFARRGVYHDCARGKVPELGTLLQLIDDMAQLKINEFQLYIENAYEFRKHPAISADTSPLTAEELMMLDSYCKARFIDFVPSLTSLGHFEKILAKKEYRHLGEIEPAALRKIAPDMKIHWDAPWTLNVSDPASRNLLRDMYDEFLPNFTSKFFNICCDESWDLGKGKSKALAAKIGTAQLYAAWIVSCNGLAKRHGKTIMLWGDIIRDHPDKLAMLPDDAILLEWGYEADHDFAGRLKLFAASGHPFYVCPGTSTWQTLTGRSANALANLRSAAHAGVQNGALGYLATDWGDFGHQQMLAISLVPLAFAAAVSWNANPDDAEILHAISHHLFNDSTGTITKLIYQLGQTCELLGSQRPNAAIDFWLFREKWPQRDYLDKVTVAGIVKVRKHVEKLAAQLTKAPINHPDAELIRAELLHSVGVVRHVMDRTLARKAILSGQTPDKKGLKLLIREAQALKEHFAQLWNARNKPSRLADVLAEWDRVIAEYAAAGPSPYGQP